LNYQAGYDFSAGIVIYMQNIIKGFNLLDDKHKPHLTVIYSKEAPINEIKELGYPYIDYYLYRPVKKNLFTKAINGLSKKILKTHLIRRYSFPDNHDLLYPYFESEETFFYDKRYYWKPDFQEMYYPQHISKNEHSYVVDRMNKIASNADYMLVLSSQDSYHDFEKFFSPYKNKIKVLRFVSIQPTLDSLDAAAILKKYNITKKYFLVANQFWPHKNHLLVLEALSNLKSQKDSTQKNLDFEIIFTGKESSYRDRGYSLNLKSYSRSNGLEKDIKFTGFIPRQEQLLLMKNAVAVIQPSLFEGWSTVIEDSKALGQFVIASDLKVNMEQLIDNCLFFNRHSVSELQSCMMKVLNGEVSASPVDYSASIERFKDDLIKVFELDIPFEN